ncbi:hypothetical protein Lal_00016771, partial [Lupinus albus]
MLFTDSMFCTMICNLRYAIMPTNCSLLLVQPLRRKTFPIFDIPEVEYDFKKYGEILAGNFQADLLVGKYPPTVSNSWCGSKILIDEEILVLQKYKDSLSCDTMSQSTCQLSQYTNLSDDNRFMYKVEKIICVTVGTTAMFIVGKHGWYYGCIKCPKKAEFKDGPFTCKCGAYNQNSITRQDVYIISIFYNISKAVGLSFGIANVLTSLEYLHACLKLDGGGEDDPKTFPLILDMILARTVALRVKVQSSYNQCSVIRQSKNHVLIKSIVDQFGILEVTLSHDVKGKRDVNNIIEYES